MALPTHDPNVNPLMDDQRTHYGIARFGFLGGVLHQQFMPCDWSTHLPEWRAVPDYTDPTPTP